MQPQASNQKSEQVAELDPAFEEAVHEYIEEVIAKEKAEFRPGVESFAVHAEKIRKSISDSMHTFQRNYAHGYNVLLEELTKIPSTDPDVDPIAQYQVSEENLALLEDPVAFQGLLDEGKAIYEALGFSVDAMNGFYDASVNLMRQSRYSDAKDAFYFLVTIAPQLVSAWLGLALCYAECSQFDDATNACEQAIALNPKSADPYLIFVRILLQMKSLGRAREVCDRGINLARASSNEPWAQPLRDALEYAKDSVR